MDFGATLRLLRTSSGLSLRELGERVGVSNAYLSRVENGHDAPPSPDRLAAIARAVGVPVTGLIELADRIGPSATRYLERVPAARELMADLVKRDLRPVDIARIRAFVAREFPYDERARLGGLPELIASSTVVAGLACDELDDVIDVAAVRLASKSANARQIGDAIRKRERECPSLLGGGLAVPHMTDPGAKPRLCVVTLREPIRAPSPDGVPIKLALVHVHGGGPEHASVLLELARLAEDETIGALQAQRDPKRLLRSLEDLVLR